MVTCLIVDDDPMACKIAADVAGSIGLEITIKSNPMDALDHCKEHMPNVIILDVLMPRIDGISFLKELHRMMGGRNPYVIACTALNDIDTVKALQNEDIKSYITKPFEISLLEKKIKESGLV